MTRDPHDCDAGWLDRDALVPCLVCKPWLERRRSPTAQEVHAARQRRQGAPSPATRQEPLPLPAQPRSAPH